MSQFSEIPTYNEIASALKKAKVDFQPSEIHGLMCGLICATPSDRKIHWETILLGKKKIPKSLDRVQYLFDSSYSQLAHFSFEFALLLPTENADINSRTEALGLWCQGFLTSLNKANVPIENREPGDATEAIADLIEISQVSFGDIAETEEDEAAYFELVEYVRLAVVMIYQELHPVSAPGQPLDGGDSLH